MNLANSRLEQWLPIANAPSGVSLEIGVMDNHEVHTLVFPCRKNGTEWVDASTNKRIDIRPTHWRRWTERR